MEDRYDRQEGDLIFQNLEQENEKSIRRWTRRNPKVSLRKLKPTSINRISAFNKEEVAIFFDNLKKVYDKSKFKEDMVFNADETGISPSRNRAKDLT
ncbi:hypothetical protein ILUMI_10690 [Ignelater luminosus]|uniref:Uncharacterized protein n=1 Tax=Ignelater luminosus TaxID=2038154 RepID=A0A8K0GDE0_IGNLU|nr:hypothetical protein ILUMI_10690 [Ignelater luminosus]